MKAKRSGLETLFIHPLCITFKQKASVVTVALNDCGFKYWMSSKSTAHFSSDSIQQLWKEGNNWSNNTLILYQRKVVRERMTSSILGFSLGNVTRGWRKNQHQMVLKLMNYSWSRKWMKVIPVHGNSTAMIRANRGFPPSSISLIDGDGIAFQRCFCGICREVKILSDTLIFNVKSLHWFRDHLKKWHVCSFSQNLMS